MEKDIKDDMAKKEAAPAVRRYKANSRVRFKIADLLEGRVEIEGFDLKQVRLVLPLADRASEYIIPYPKVRKMSRRLPPG